MEEMEMQEGFQFHGLLVCFHLRDLILVGVILPQPHHLRREMQPEVGMHLKQMRIEYIFLQPLYQVIVHYVARMSHMYILSYLLHQNLGRTIRAFILLCFL